MAFSVRTAAVSACGLASLTPPKKGSNFATTRTPRRPWSGLRQRLEKSAPQEPQAAPSRRLLALGSPLPATVGLSSDVPFAASTFAPDASPASGGLFSTRFAGAGVAGGRSVQVQASTARIIARMPARIASGTVGQASVCWTVVSPA